MAANPPATRTPLVGDDRAIDDGAAGAPLRQASLWRDAWSRYVRNLSLIHI